MEIAKTRPVSNTVVFSLCFAVCFAALIHVEIELHAHRQMLQALNQKLEENLKPGNLAHKETISIDSALKTLSGDSAKGK